MKNPSYKNKNIERKYLNNMGKNLFLKVKNSLLELGKDFIELRDREFSLLELEKDFIELRDRELKDREAKIN